MTVFAFPTHREGFGNVAVEAGAAELPVVTFNSTGAVDAVRNGVTGTVVPVGDTKALANAILRYLNDNDLRFSMDLPADAVREPTFDPSRFGKKWMLTFASYSIQTAAPSPWNALRKRVSPPSIPRLIVSTGKSDYDGAMHQSAKASQHDLVKFRSRITQRP